VKVSLRRLLIHAVVSISVGAGRPRVSPGAVGAAQRWLTKRDRGVLTVLEEHFTFSTSQLATLAGFTSVVTARHRLATLHSRRVLGRARPFRPGGGSMQWHWLLGPIGAKILGAQRGITLIRPAGVALRWARLFHGWRYEELSAQHAWFCALIGSAGDLTGSGGQLVRWHCAWRVSRAWRATTDGHGVWRCPDGRQLAFLLELDDPPRVGVGGLRERIAGIPDPSVAATLPKGFPDGVVTLIWCATLRREQTLRRAITTHLGASTGIPVALACAEYAHCVPGAALGRVWIPLGALPHRQPGRLTLFELADAIARPIVIKPNRNRMHADDELILNNFDIDIA
jgi:hypothetical protein